MKILITTDWYSPAVNGVVTSVLNLRRELELRGHEVRVLTLSQDLHSSVQDGVIRDGENGWQFRDFSDFMSKLETFRAHPELRRALSEQAAASARDYSAEEFARRVEAIYLAQIARRSGREEVSA